jgi:predicted MFS family arabinose efflux permease
MFNASFRMWIIWLLASFFYAYQYILRVTPSVLMSDLLAKFHVSAEQFGQFSGVYYIGYAAMHIPIGILLDRVGPKIILPLSLILSVLGLMPLIYSDEWAYPTLGRLFIGMGSSGAILGVFKIIRLGFGDAKFNRMLGISVTIGLIGAIWGGLPLQFLLDTLGLEKLIWLVSAIGILLALSIYIAVPKQKPLAMVGNASILIDIKNVLTNKKVLAVCLLGGMMVGPLEGFADVWGKEFLKSNMGFDNNLASGLPSYIFFGMCFGAPIITYLADKFRSYFGFIIAGAVIMASSFVWIFSSTFTPFELKILFSLVGVMCAYQILVIYLASTFVDETVVGLTTACANMIIMLFGYMFHTIIGKLMDINWDGTLVEGVRVYPPEAFVQGLSIIPIGLIVGAIGFTLVKLKK